MYTNYQWNAELGRVHNDDWGRAIVERLEHVNLVAADIEYHNSLMEKLDQAPHNENVQKGRYANEIDTAM